MRANCVSDVRDAVQDTRHLHSMLAQRAWHCIAIFSTLAACLAAGCLGHSTFNHRGDEINAHNFARIQPGMSETDVNNVFGIPAGFHRSGLVTGPLFPNDDVFDEQKLTRMLIAQKLIESSQKAKMWYSDKGFVAVVFDHQGKVTRTQLGFSDERLMKLRLDAPTEVRP